MSSKTAHLILQDGTVFTGESFGAIGEATGEIVFTTGVTGYLETLTDPNYYGQIIVQTFPLIGNYGVISADLESCDVHANAYIVKHLCQEPSNFRSEGSLDFFLKQHGIVGLSGIDTRKLTKIIRNNGVMNGRITTSLPSDADKQGAVDYRINNAVAAVSRDGFAANTSDGKHRIAVLDLGAKSSLYKALQTRDCRTSSFTYNASADDILGVNPDGIVISGGPGNPADPANAPIVEQIKKLVASDKPILGIGLGHQLLAVAHGYTTEALPFGHRGSNQPVKDLAYNKGRVYMSAQNHGYTVVADSIKDKRVSFVNVNDGACEGLDYGTSMSVQFNPCGEFADTSFILDEFVKK
ncbi:MAG: carbamoyl phosphate synthase small subunit [Oscillospiraceae bacterium]|nr:carbamoyl phosphate synthase small subunit [Oscillospiraceae bacterium]